MTIGRRFGRALERERYVDVFLVRLTRFEASGGGGGGAKRQFGSPTGRTTGGDERESIHPTRLLTHKGSADLRAAPPAGPLYTLLADLLACRTGRTGKVLDTVILSTQTCYLGRLEGQLAPRSTILVV